MLPLQVLLSSVKLRIRALEKASGMAPPGDEQQVRAHHRFLLIAARGTCANNQLQAVPAALGLYLLLLKAPSLQSAMLRCAFVQSKRRKLQD